MTADKGLLAGAGAGGRGRIGSMIERSKRLLSASETERRTGMSAAKARVGMFATVMLAAVLLAGTVFAQAKSVIFLIGDGMGKEQVRAASIKLLGADGRLAMLGMPVAGSLSTRSASSDVTDSAAAGTALATGHKTNNGTVSIAPDGKILRTILEACRDSGKSVGVTVTSPVTDATPAVFASHVKSRGSQYEIAGQMVKSRLNVIFGGGKSQFLVPKGEIWVGVDVQDSKGVKLLEIKDRIDWTDYRGTERGFLAPAGAAKADVWVWRGEGAVDAFVDDFDLHSVAAKDKPESGNLLANADFEQGSATGWNVWSECEVAKDGSSRALKVLGGGGCDQAVVVKPGDEFVFEYRGRVVDPNAGGLRKATPWDEAGKAGYLRIEKKQDLAGARGRYVLGLFKDGALENTPDEPSLAEMAGKAMELLSSNPAGFFLMVEGSQIDWANHGNDEKDFFRQMGWFNETVIAALSFAKARGDVLVVVAADHETGGMSVAGTDAASLKVKYSTKGHTSTDVPLFAFGPGSEKFAGKHDNTDVPKLIAEALNVKF